MEYPIQAESQKKVKSCLRQLKWKKAGKLRDGIFKTGINVYGVPLGKYRKCSGTAQEQNR